VEYTAPGMVDPPRVDIYLRASVSNDQGVAVACSVLFPITRPAVKDEDMEVLVWTSTHDFVIASDAPCAQ
jgi:hypothetical protein